MSRFICGLMAALLVSASAAAQEGTRLRPAERAAILEEIADTVNEAFYDEARAAQIAADLRAADFSAIATHEAFAEALTARLHEEDRHFAVRYLGPREVARMLEDHERERADEGGDPFAAARRGNFGFEEVSILPGNIGYIKFDQFAPAGVAGDTARAALDFVAHTDAIIFDMRENTGGDPSMVQFMISHFLHPAESIAINTFVSRQTEYPQQLNSLNYHPSGHRPDVPVYVLTSGGTGSAGEAFPYHLQALERATIVGEVTYGAGNPGDTFFLDAGYAIFISTGSARNPITGTNWEGVGVQPDIETPAPAALDTALLDAYDTLLASDAPDDQKLLWTWGREEIGARLEPMDLTEDQLADYVGSYGPRRVFADGGTLYYQREDRDPIVLTPVGEDRFLYGDDGRFRVAFERDRGGRVTALAIDSLVQPRSVSERD